jgi:hypothetical protein
VCAHGYVTRRSGPRRLLCHARTGRAPPRCRASRKTTGASQHHSRPYGAHAAGEAFAERRCSRRWRCVQR